MLHPCREWCLDVRVDDVGEVLSREFVDLLLDRQVVIYSGVLLQKLQHVFDRKTFVLGNLHVPYLLCPYVLLGTRRQVFEMPDGDLICLREIVAAFSREETITFDLVGEPGVELR